MGNPGDVGATGWGVGVTGMLVGVGVIGLGREDKIAL